MRYPHSSIDFPLSCILYFEYKSDKFNVKFLQYTFLKNFPDIHGIMVKLFANGTGDPGSIPSRALPYTSV